jgi:hypothetical protein
MSEERGLTPSRWGFRCEWQQLNAVSRHGTLRASCKYLWAGLCGEVKRNRKNQPCYDRHSSHNGARFKWLLSFATVGQTTQYNQSVDHFEWFVTRQLGWPAPSIVVRLRPS